MTPGWSPFSASARITATALTASRHRRLGLILELLPLVLVLGAALLAQHPTGLGIGRVLGGLGRLDLGIDVRGRAAGDRATQPRHGVVDDLGGDLADLGDEDGLSRL